MTELDIKQYLQLLPKNEEVYYIPNPGNAGDSLLAHTTFQLFKELNIRYRLIDFRDFDPRAKIIIYGGGGNLVEYYNFARRIVLEFHRLAKKFIILPHSINGNEDLLKELGNNVDIILREEVSYNHVKKFATKSNIMIMEDLLFSINVEDLLPKKSVTISLLGAFFSKVIYRLLGIKNNFTVRKNLQNIKSEHLKIIFGNYCRDILHCFRTDVERILGIRNREILNCFRTDSEKTDVDLPRDNLDLSQVFSYGTENEKIAFRASLHLLSFMNRYREIRTNRLHLGIAGMLLGKKVKLSPNSYYKCEAVYQYSIKDRFSNVEWTLKHN